VKATAFLAATLLAACAGARVHAQTPGAPQTPATVPPTQSPPTVAAPQSPPTVAAPRATPETPATVADQRDVRMMEIVLTNAVRTGAENLSRQMQAREPGSFFVVDTAHARGFVLEGYGVFFAVDIPMMRQAAVWSARQVLQQDLRDKIQELSQIAQNAANDPETRRQASFQARLLSIQLQGAQGGTVSPQANTVAVPQPQLNAGAAQPIAGGSAPAPGTVRSADVPDVAVTSPTAVSPLRDPNELYTEAVKTALIDAMLKHSFSLRIADNEWLTVAARDGEGPAVPGQLDDASTIIIRIKGSDLSAFITNKLSREEVLKRVQIREF
jgi:hypothetical protein